MFSENLARIRRNQRSAKSKLTLTNIAIAALALFVLGMATGYITFSGGQICFQGTCYLSSNGISTTQTQSGVNNGLTPQYLGFQWQAVSGGTSPSAVSVYGYPVSNPSNYWTKASATVLTQYTSVQSSFSLASGGFCYQVYSTSAYPYAQCTSSAGVTTSSAFPSYTTSVTPTTCLISSTSTNCINVAPTYPNSYTNATTSVTAVTTTLIPSFSGTTIPSTTFSLTLNFVGVSGRGGGVGQDQLASGSVLGGVANQPVQVYTNGNGVPATAGQIVSTQSVAFITTNQTNLALNSCGAGTNGAGAQTGQIYNSNNIYKGTNVWYVIIPAAAVFTSNAASTPQYLFAQITCSFTNNSIPGSKDIALVFNAYDDQQAVGFDIPKFLDNSGLTGTAACTSATTTNMCSNSSDITVGTYQAIAGTPVAQGGGGSGSSTKPAWITPTTGPNAGWATFAVLYSVQGGTVVYGT